MGAARLDGQGVIVSCPSCSKANRIGYGKVGGAGKCGQCHAALPPPAEPIEVPSAALFDALVADSAVPVLIDFWAPWCGPCRIVAPELAKVARATMGQLVVAKVNTDALPELGARYAVQSIPTMAVFHRGREVTRTMGARPAAGILDFVQQAAGR